MIILKSNAEIEKMYAANQIVAEVLAYLAEKIMPDMTTDDLNRIADEMIRKKGGTPTFIGYRGYPKALCTSINEEVVHGIPGKRVLLDGDMIGVDCGVTYQGYVGDSARTFAVGSVDAETAQLMRVTKECLDRAIQRVQVGNRIGDIGQVVQAHAESYGYTVVRDFVGHGVGRSLHEEPQVPNYGKSGEGARIKAGLVLAIEPMINMGSAEVEVLADGWTVVTKDRKRSAHYEHSIACTVDGPRVLSLL